MKYGRETEKWYANSEETVLSGGVEGFVDVG